MTVGSGGVEYENKVMAAVKRSTKNLDAVKILPGSSTAAFASNEPDLKLQLFGQYPINIEIKADAKAQMGGGSYNYDMKSGRFELSGKTHIDKIVSDKLLEILSTKKSALNKLLKYVKENDVAYTSTKVSGLPLTATKTMWEKLTSSGLLVPLNSKMDVPIRFLFDHYAKKNCFYIQIGGAGFYYLKSNPLNLPIPQLSANMKIELRLARAGSKYNQTIKKDIASGNIRAQGRLSDLGQISKYSIDKADDFTFLFGNVSKTLAAKLK